MCLMTNMYSCSAMVHTYTYLDLQWYYYTRVKLSLRSLSVVPYNILSITLYFILWIVQFKVLHNTYMYAHCTVHTYVNVTI